MRYMTLRYMFLSIYSTICSLFSRSYLIAEDFVYEWQGFCDKEMNKKLLKKNVGSIKRAVMDLITGEKP